MRQLNWALGVILLVVCTGCDFDSFTGPSQQNGGMTSNQGGNSTSASFKNKYVEFTPPPGYFEFSNGSPQGGDFIEKQWYAPDGKDYITLRTKPLTTAVNVASLPTEPDLSAPSFRLGPDSVYLEYRDTLDGLDCRVSISESVSPSMYSVLGSFGVLQEQWTLITPNTNVEYTNYGAAELSISIAFSIEPETDKEKRARKMLEKSRMQIQEKIKNHNGFHVPRETNSSGSIGGGVSAYRLPRK